MENDQTGQQILPCFQPTTLFKRHHQNAHSGSPPGTISGLTAGQGVCNSGSSWCRYSDKILKDTEACKGVDDLILQAPTVKALIPKLKDVLEAAKKGGMVFSRKKVEFGTQVNFCGYLIDEKGCHPSPNNPKFQQSS